MINEKGSTDKILLLLTLSLTTLYFNVSYFDPFNLPKMTLLGIFAVFAVRQSLKYLSQSGFRNWNLTLITLLLIFLTSLVLNYFLNDVSVWQFFMGTYQRNLGFITYLLFVIFSVWISLVKVRGLAEFYLYILIAVGGVEVLYGLIQNNGKDFIAWNNPYSPIIGTFGNPNYMSAFLGLASSAALILILSRNQLTLGMKFVLMSIVILGQYLCVLSSSVQGNFVFLTCISLFLGILIHRRYTARVSALFFSSLALGFAFVIAALNNKGPLASFLYQTSISARGDYWRAAFKATTQEPFKGSGMDNFSTVYLSYRDLNQVQNRGFGTFTNNAHNTFLQLSSTTGILSSLTIILTILFVLVTSLKRVLDRSKEFDAMHVGVLSLFSACLPIMLISIDNIGFSIWFWTLCGLLASNPIESQRIQKINRGKIRTQGLILDVAVAVAGIIYMIFVIGVGRADTYVREIFQSESKLTSPSDLYSRFESRPSFVNLEPRYLTTFSAMAISKKWFQESTNFAERVIEIDPNNLDGWRLKALSHEGLNQNREAVAAREVILQIDRFRLDNMLELTRGYLKLNLPSKADETVQKMQDIAPNDTFTLAAVQAYKDYLG